MEAFEPPKYITSLIAAVNDGAKSAQLGALAFTAIGLFLLATALSATDEDLLLNRALTISQLGGTAVPVVFAFGLAPAVFVAVHFYTLIRYDMLAGNIRRFVGDLAAMVPIDADRDRCRQLLANVEFVNWLAMPKGARASSWMFDWTVRALLAVFPVGGAPLCAAPVVTTTEPMGELDAPFLHIFRPSAAGLVLRAITR